MIRMCDGSIFDADVEALVNPVNTVGVMGAGLAKKFKERWPGMFWGYESTCKAGELNVGEVFLWRPNWRNPDPRFIVCLPTKRHYRDASRLEDIESGLVAMIPKLQRFRVRSVAIPALGCGLGGLDWADVLPLIERVMGGVPGIETHIYPPKGG